MSDWNLASSVCVSEVCLGWLAPLIITFYNMTVREVVQVVPLNVDKHSRCGGGFFATLTRRLPVKLANCSPNKHGCM